MQTHPRPARVVAIQGRDELLVVRMAVPPAWRQNSIGIENTWVGVRFSEAIHRLKGQSTVETKATSTIRKRNPMAEVKTLYYITWRRGKHQRRGPAQPRSGCTYIDLTGQDSLDMSCAKQEPRTLDGCLLPGVGKCANSNGSCRQTIHWAARKLSRGQPLHS